MKYHVRILAGRVDRGAGSHVYHQEMVRRLAVRGHRVSLVCFEGTPEVRDCAEVVEVRPARFDRWPWLWRYASALNHRRCGRGLLAAGLPPADVVIGGEHLFLRAHRRAFPATPWVYQPQSLLVRHEIESYGLPPAMERATLGLYERIQRWALGAAQRTCRFTRAACRALAEYYGDAARPRFVVNPQGIDLPERPSGRPDAGPVRLLWVGQLIPRKRIDVALEAVAGLAGGDWVFDVVGDGASRRELEALAARRGVADRVRFHGFRPDPSPWYREADLLLFPSWLENYPVTMLEAMSFGVPCLAMRGDGVRYHNANEEMIDHGRDGFLADSDEDFARQLATLVGAPSRLRAAGEAARRRVAVSQTWDDHLDRYEELFEQFARERARGRSALRPSGVR
jgi:glycosyltransferase involved in cell wall biosynthesis